MNFNFSHFKKLDRVLILCAVFLTLLGLVSIYSSSFRDNDFLNFKKQAIFLAIGFFIMIAVSFFDYRSLKNNSLLILILYLFGLVLLAGLFLFGAQTRGIKGWYKIGPVSFDPISPIKIVLIILLAKYFSMRHVEMYRFRHIIFSGIYVFLPSIFIFFQPDLGSVLILIMIWAGVLIISGIKIRHFLILLLCSLLILALGWQFLLRDYQKQRIMSFLVPYDPLGVSWSQRQAKIAIGSSSLFGKGPKQGSQTQYGFLPEPQTDFIFASLTEEMGLIGVIILFSLFAVLLERIIKTAKEARSNFARIFSLGLAIFLFSQFFVNVGMNLGILPIIGLPLPLVSYGGSSLISIYIGLGIVESIRVFG